MKLNLHFIARDQFLPYLNREQRWAAVVAHRRAGKTVACIMDLIRHAIEHQGREPRFAYIAPTFSQAKDVAWSYLKEYTAAIPGIDKSESELSVVFPHNKARIRLYGAENYDRIRGIYLDGAVIDEAGDIDPRAWPEVIRPSLADRKGWATFIGTPKGRNSFYEIVLRAEADSGWYHERLRASETKLVDDEELLDARKILTPEQYAQEFECSFDAAVIGAYYGKEVAEAEADKRITKVPYDKAADVYCAWDLGIGDAMALWFYQIIGREWHFINYYENNGFGLDHYVDYVKALPYKVHHHKLPHDAEARELQTGKSRIEYLEGRQLKCEIVPLHKVDDRINAVRMGFNRFWFDKDNCAHGIDCLRMYRAGFDDKNKVLRAVPMHDWSSHGADAFGIGIMGTSDSVKLDMPQIETGWAA